MTVSSVLDWEELKRPTPPMTPRPSTPASSSAVPAAPTAAAAFCKPSSRDADPPGKGVTVFSSADVSSVLNQLSLDDFLNSQELAFQAFSAARASASNASPSSSPAAVQTPLRISLALSNHTTLFMPAALAGLPPTCKIVSILGPSAPAEIAARGLPGSTVVLDSETGEVAGLINAGELTGVRTAAGSAVASRTILGKGEGRTKIVVFGSGVQAFWHSHLHLLLFPSLAHLALIARPSHTSLDARTKAVLDRLQALHPNVEIEHSCVEGYDRGQAVHNADLILCCTPSTEPLFPATQPRRGTHISLIGSYKPHMREVAPELLASRTGGIVYVDGADECRAEAGELKGYEGKLVEIGSLGKADIETREDADLTVWKSVGLGVQDVAITDLVFRKGRTLGLGQVVAF